MVSFTWFDEKLQTVIKSFDLLHLWKEAGFI